MKLPLQITFQGIPHSDALEERIQKKALKLDRFCDHIMRCHVVISAPHKHHHKGKLYNIRIDITVPNKEIVVSREENEDIFVSVRDPFNAAARQLEDYVRQRRGYVKIHEERPYGWVRKLVPEGGYGFLETPDGQEIYFHQNSVINENFNKLEIGTKVYFAQEMGEEGPQASTDRVVGKESNLHTQ